MTRLFGKALLCLVAAFAAYVFARLVYKHFSWPQVKADAAEFFRTMAEGDATLIIAALASAPVMVIAGLILIGALVLWDTYRKRGQRRATPPSARAQDTREKQTPAAAGPGGRSSSDGNKARNRRRVKRAMHG